MRIDIFSRGIPLTEAIRAHTQQRLTHALNQHADHVGTVKVQIQDINGPRGGRDKECLVMVGLLPSKSLVIKEVHSDLYVAVSLAADRVKRVVGRTLARTPS
jgi:ribosomal subunit interface protein